ncbi:hypothetical protein ACFWYW_58525 [Nonomuraea sp. NPDC059023]|uniref:hypothetical protein n=1 Tax=unclassified Nonomuraea TaxID=2593643 RepID=UPI003682CE40
MIYYLVMDLDFVCTQPDDSEEDFDAFTDRVMDELLKLESLKDSGIVGPDSTAGLSERTMSILMGVDASTRQDATRLFLANVRCALHAAECSTADWPNYEPAADELPPVRTADFAEA